MVSYFVPRGRFLIKAGNLRQAQKQQLQQQQAKWPVLHQFRQTFATKPKQTTTSTIISESVATKTFVKRSTTTSAKKARNNLIDNKSLEANEQIEIKKTTAQYQNSWRRWTGFLLRWAPMGIFMIGAIEWQWHKHKCASERIERSASQFQTKIYCSLPLRIISRCWGWLAACYIPTPLRPLVYGCYSSAFNVNIEEALHSDYKHYNSLSEFFTRALRDGVRPIDEQAPMVSPADGRVLHFGTVNANSLIEKVKGVNYSLDCFLGPPTWKSERKHQHALGTIDYAETIKEKNDGKTALYQCIIYLAPGDYHRFHSPAEWTPAVRRHFAGELLSVNPRVANWMPELFCLNERALYLGSWHYGFFSYTAVGATNVGSVQIYMDEQLKTNRWLGWNIGAHKQIGVYDELILDGQKTLQKGELLGQFNMGSTIVLIFEAPKNFVFDIECGKKIAVGDRLGHLA